MTWQTFETQSPELAEFASIRLHNKVAYIATARKDGSPRVHPFTPIIGEGHFFVFMEPTSPKGHDCVATHALPYIVPSQIPVGKAVRYFSPGMRRFLKPPKCEP